MPNPSIIASQLVETAQQSGHLAQLQTEISAHQYLRLYNLTLARVQTGSAVLDWGCGNGHFSYFLCRAGYRVDSFEFSETPQLCQAFSPDVYKHTSGSSADPSSLPYADASFQAVFSIGVLEHVRETGGDEIASLREVHRVLEPGGVFVCYHLPNRYSWIEAGLRLLGRWSHQYRYTTTGIQRICEAAELTVTDVQRYAILPRNIFWWGLPPVARNSTRLAHLYDGVDNLLSVLLSPICQNYLFVAQKEHA